MIKKCLCVTLALLTLLPLILSFPCPAFAKEFTLARFFTGDTSDWEIWVGTTSLVLSAFQIDASAVAADINEKTGKFAWYLSFNGGKELRIDPATCVQHSESIITLRFPTYACGFSPSYNPAGAEDNGIYYDLSLRVENKKGDTVYTASVNDLHSTLTDPAISDTVTLDGSRSGTGFSSSLPSGKSTTSLLFTVKNSLAPTLFEKRGDYRWHLVYENEGGRYEQDLFPSAFDGNTLFYFEPCLGAPSFIPQKGQNYFVTLELWQEDHLAYFAGGTIYGYLMDHDAIYSDKSYTVTWDVAGKITTSSVFEGALPFYPEGTPKMEHPSLGMRYRFAGWSPEITAATGDVTYTALFAEERIPFDITFAIGDKELTKTYYEADLPTYPYTFEEERADGLYDLFLGFDQRITAVSAAKRYEGVVKKGLSRDQFDLLTLTCAEITAGGKAVVYLVAEDPVSSFEGLLISDPDRFTVADIRFEEGIDGSYSDNLLSFSCDTPKKGLIATLTFLAQEGKTGGYALDLLPALYKEGARLVAIAGGYLQITQSLHGDEDQNGILDLSDADLYLSALKKAPETTLDDCYPDGVLSIKDLSALLCRLSGIPFPLYKNADSRTLSYTVKEGGEILGKKSQTVKGTERPSPISTASISDFYTFLGWSDGYGSPERTDSGAVFGASFEACYLETVPDLTIPVLKISTGGVEITSNIDYISATVSSFGCDEEYKFEDLGIRIRGRGNAAWDAFRTIKPSYKMNFNEQISLFGLGGKDKDWLLISTYTDKSFLRNYAAYRLGQMLEGNLWSPSFMFVEIYLNGDYKGVYLLCEQIEANGHKLQLDDEKEEPDKDYLLELDHRASFKGADPLTYFEIAGGQQPFVIQSTVNSVKERAFIAKEVKKLHTALMSGNEEQIRALCDINSLVDNYIIQELATTVTLALPASISTARTASFTSARPGTLI